MVEEKETIVVAGALANKCFNGGAAWTRLSWILGLRNLGFAVHFLEQIDPADCADARGRRADFEKSANLRFFRQALGEHGLTESAALICGDGERVAGAAFEELEDLADRASVLINISGHLKIDRLLQRFRGRVYLDLDPGFTQFWRFQGHGGLGLEKHHLHFTVGENIGDPRCPIPSLGIQWRPIRQPAPLECWPVAAPAASDRFTTVGSWRGPYGPVVHDGKSYGLKVHEFRRFADLPRRAPARFELALDIHSADEADRARLVKAGWKLADPRKTAGCPSAFRRYVQSSGAEFSVAQAIYVETGSGWFSDRTVRYLASGRPALVQDTGFSRNYPVGQGLLAFRNMAEAVQGVVEIRRNYEAHCRAARKLAEERFDSRIVMNEFMNEIRRSL